MLRLRGLPELIEQMLKCEHGVMQQHPWASVSHHRPDLFPLCGWIAVNGTIRTGGLCNPKRTLAEAKQGKVKQVLAIKAQMLPLGSTMPLSSPVPAAVDPDHSGQCSGFTP
jgi:hypothetical protein